MRVTNGELHILEKMDDAQIGEKMGLVKLIRRLSADLLESRELIKEMREYINGLPNEVTDGTKAISILEKTKDYA